MSTLRRMCPAIDFAIFAEEHLAYEARMFAFARDLFHEKARGQTRLDAETKLVGEACLLHCRNLLDFFYPTTVKADDVIALNYAADWETSRPSIPPELDLARTRMHKELAHFTANRKDASAPDKDWNFSKISAQLRPVIDEFIRLADQTLLPEQVRAELGEIPPSVTVVVGSGPVFNSSS